MERLTKKIDNGRFVTTDAESRSYGETDPEDGFFYNYFTGEAVDKLAAYEDTGLEPEEVQNIVTFENEKIFPGKELTLFGKPISHLAKINNAEQEGRLVVLPCKVGDTVYVFHTGRRNCKWPHNMKKGKIYEVTVSGLRLHDWSDDWSALLFFDAKEMTGDYEFSFGEFGKTVFLTREEAEKAMEVRG